MRNSTFKMYHQKRGSSVFHLEKIKKQNEFLCKFQRNLKELSFLCEKYVSQKYLYKTFDNSNLQFGKKYKSKIKK